MGSIQPWEQTASQKRALRDQAMRDYMVLDLDQRPPRVQDVHKRSALANDPVAQEITDIDSIPALLELLGSGKYTVENVVLAYIKRYVHHMLNVQDLRWFS